jgi:hypothetical protein
MTRNQLLALGFVAAVASCGGPGPLLAQELTGNLEPWTFNISAGVEPPVCNLQVQGYTRDGFPGPLLVLQYENGYSTMTITFSNINEDVMTLANANGSAFARLILSTADAEVYDQASFVPDFPIFELFTATRIISFAEQETPSTPYAFIDMPMPPFNALEDWNRCATSF